MRPTERARRQGHPWLLAAGLLLAAGATWVAVGCAEGVTVEDDPIGGGATGTGGGTTTTTLGGGGAAGAGGNGGSCDPEQCPGVDTDCHYRICTPADECGFADAPASTPCVEDGGAVCDGQGSCVECVVDDDCPGDDKCSSQTCVPATCLDGQQGQDETDVDCGGVDCPPCDNGEDCEVYSDCKSQYCAGTVCAPCADDDDCADATNTWCDSSVASGSCVAQRANGDTCTGGNQCLSGHCPDDDSVCCNNACGATCEACLLSKTGVANGTCALIAAYDDPDGECPVEAPSTCGSDGSGCSGTLAACVPHPSGTECVPASCSAGQETTQGTCDGLGTCEGSVINECEPYVCNPGGTACLSSCTSESDCAAGYTCDTNVCVPACSLLASVSAPTNHINFGSTYGQWMADPLETLGPGKLWVMDGYTGTSIQEYANLAALVSQSPTTSWSLTTAKNGTGAVVYDGFLYYNKDNSPNMIKYDLAAHSQVLDVPLPNAGYHNTYAYQWGGYSDIDFAVDEQGLWVIYSTSGNGGNIVLSKLDPANLSVVQTWNTSKTKQCGNAFVICGILYTTNSYSSENTTIDFRYDTATSTGQSMSVAFNNPGHYNSMVDYNPNDQLLYAWDSGQHLTYTLGF